MKHGILSKESFIGVGDGKEDADVFIEFGSDLRDTLNPVGAVEELLVDKLIGATWRMRRVLRFETAAIRNVSDNAVGDWEHKQANDLRVLSGKSRWRTKEELDSTAKRLKKDRKALSEEKPIEVRVEIWQSVFDFVSTRFEVEISELLGLEGSCEDYTGYSKGNVLSVVAVARKKTGISELQFWLQAKQYTQSKLEQVEKELEWRDRDIERIRLAASIPIERDLNKIQRYESHLSREFYKALHELQRLQAARLGYRPSVPLALDIEVDPAPLQGAE